MLFSAPAGAKNRPARDHDRSTVGLPVDMAGKFDSRKRRFNIFCFC